MITIQNNQTKIPLDIDQITKDAQYIAHLLDYDNFDLGIQFVNDKKMHEYNKKYRHKDKPTDILSFPFHPQLKAGQRIEPKNDDEKSLGDIIIAPEYVQNDLARWDQTFDERIRVLLVHGICHLLGYDHIKDEDYEVMKKQEESLLTTLKKGSQ